MEHRKGSWALLPGFIPFVFFSIFSLFMIIMHRYILWFSKHLLYIRILKVYFASVYMHNGWLHNMIGWWRNNDTSHWWVLYIGFSKLNSDEYYMNEKYSGIYWHHFLSLNSKESLLHLTSLYMLISYEYWNWYRE